MRHQGWGGPRGAARRDLGQLEGTERGRGGGVEAAGTRVGFTDGVIASRGYGEMQSLHLPFPALRAPGSALSSPWQLSDKHEHGEAGWRRSWLGRPTAVSPGDAGGAGARAGDVGARRTEAWWEDPRFTEGDPGRGWPLAWTPLSQSSLWLPEKQENVAQV